MGFIQILKLVYSVQLVDKYVKMVKIHNVLIVIFIQKFLIHVLYVQLMLLVLKLL